MDKNLKNVVKEALGCELDSFSVEYQSDGLTNKNFIIADDSNKYAVRIGRENFHELGINRSGELAAMKAAADIGVGADIIYFSEDTGNMVTVYIEGKKWSYEDVVVPANLLRLADTLKRVHRLPPVLFEFSPYRDIEDRINYAKQHNMELPEFINELLDKMHSIKNARDEKKQFYTGLCHNDPFPNNFLDDGSLRLIDWEYAGMGDIFFDLSIVCMPYTRSQKEEFLRNYFGYCDEEKMDGLEKMGFIVAFWNAMWAMLQAGAANTGNDYSIMARQMFVSLKEYLQET